MAQVRFCLIQSFFFFFIRRIKTVDRITQESLLLGDLRCLPKQKRKRRWEGRGQERKGERRGDRRGGEGRGGRAPRPWCLLKGCLRCLSPRHPPCLTSPIRLTVTSPCPDTGAVPTFPRRQLTPSMSDCFSFLSLPLSFPLVWVF